jgi:hypothetical protein
MEAVPRLTAAEIDNEKDKERSLDSDQTEDQDKGDIADERLDKGVPAYTDYDKFDEEGQPVVNPNDMLLVMGMDSEEKHKKKWEAYLKDKKKLLKEGWTVVRDVSKLQGINVGETVKERGGLKQQGTVLTKDPSPKGKAKWTILFDGKREPTSGVESTKLKLIRDEWQMTWKTCQDSNPAGNTVEAFQNNGVVDFDFDVFSKEALNMPNDDHYEFPFVKLLLLLDQDI